MNSVWMDWAAILSLLLYFLAICLILAHKRPPAIAISWVALLLATVSGTLGLSGALAVAIVQIWRHLDSSSNLFRGLLFSLFMMLALFRLIPGVGSFALQLPAAPDQPLMISWAAVIVAWLVLSNFNREHGHMLSKTSWLPILSYGLPLGLLAAAINLSFRWDGPLQLPSSPGPFALWFVIWASLDLFFISVSDEALYRGSILQLILRICGQNLLGWSIALMGAASLFALQHWLIAADPFLGSLAVGLVFGICALLSGYLEAAILAHFTCDLALLAYGMLPSYFAKIL